MNPNPLAFAPPKIVRRMGRVWNLLLPQAVGPVFVCQV